MQFLLSKKGVTTVLVFVMLCIGMGAYVYIKKQASITQPTQQEIVPEVIQETVVTHERIGSSVEGRSIDAYTYGTGDTHLLFVGGIHGGYEWNSVLLSYKFMDYLEANPDVIPESLAITVIPSANPDGVYAVVGKEGRFTAIDVPTESTTAGLGRFNANDVDLNRNFDCKWKKESMWRGNVVDAGTNAFSEPEAVAIRDFVLTHKPQSVVFWHSQSNAVYASECKKGILPETLAIMNTYSKAAGYKAVDSFDAYEITGDAEGWLASIDIPAITVELATHNVIQWEQNLAGIKALFTYYKPETMLSR